METTDPAGTNPQPTVVGWRERVALPELGVAHLRVKVDTGARTSALHAEDIEPVVVDGLDWVVFTVPLDDDTTVSARAPVIDHREVRSSSGEAQLRPVVSTVLVMAGQRMPIELTLTGRDEMGFRMLVGRQALRQRFVVDPGRSWVGGPGDG